MAGTAALDVDLHAVDPHLADLRLPRGLEISEGAAPSGEPATRLRVSFAVGGPGDGPVEGAPEEARQRAWERAARVSGRIGIPHLPALLGCDRAAAAVTVCQAPWPAGSLADGPMDAARLVPVLHQLARALVGLREVGLAHGLLHPALVRIGARFGRDDAVVLGGVGLAELVTPGASRARSGATGDLAALARLGLARLTEDGSVAAGRLRALLEGTRESCDDAGAWLEFEVKLCDLRDELRLRGPWTDLPRPRGGADTSGTSLVAMGSPVVSLATADRVMRALSAAVAVALGGVLVAQDVATTTAVRGDAPTNVAAVGVAPPAVDVAEAVAVVSAEGAASPSGGAVVDPDVPQRGAAAVLEPAAPALATPPSEVGSLGSVSATGVGSTDRGPGAAALVAEARKALAAGRRDEATKLFHRALERDPGATGALIGLSELSFDAGDYAQAVRFASRAVQRAPKNAVFRMQLGDSYLKTLDYAKAREHYQRALDLGHAPARERLAKLESKLGR